MIQVGEWLEEKRISDIGNEFHTQIGRVYLSDAV